MKFTLSILCFLAFYTPHIFAQEDCEFILSGVTKEEHNPSPLSYAVIKVVELDTIITSDDEGHYILQDVCKGNYTLICSFLGFRADTQQVYVDRDMGVFFTLHPEDCELDEVVVQDYRGSTYPVQSEVISMAIPRKTQFERSKVNTISTGFVTRAISGGSSLNTGNNTAKPVFHGLHSNRLRIVQNGIPIENQQWGAEHGLDLGDFDNPEITSRPLFYHDALGGVLLSSSRVFLTDFGSWKEYTNGEEYSWYDRKLEGQLNTNLSSNGQSNVTSGHLGGNVGIAPYIGWKVFGGIGRGGDVHTPNYNLRNTGFSNHHYGGQTQINLGEVDLKTYYKNVNQQSGIFTGSHIGNTTDFYNAVEAKEPSTAHTGEFAYTIGGPFQQINHEMGAVTLAYNGSKGNNYLVRYSRQYNKRQEFDVHDVENADLHLELTTHQVYATANFYVDSSEYDRNITLGITAMDQKNTWRNRQFVPNYRRQKGGVHVGFTTRNKWDEKGLLVASANYDLDQTDVFLLTNEQVERQELFFHSPWLALEYQTRFKEKYVTKNEGRYRYSTELTFGFANTWRAPAINELYSGGIHHSAASLELGNPDLEREDSYKLYVKLQRPTESTQWTITFHANMIPHYIYAAPTGEVVLTTQGAFPEFTYQQTDALLSGIDADFEQKITHRLQSTSKITFLHAYDFDEKNGLIGIPPNRIEEQMTYKLHSSDRTELIVGGNASYFLRQYNSNLNFELVDPPKGYVLLGTSISYRMIGNLDKGGNDLTFRLEVNNLLNTTYRDYMNRNRFFTDEMGRNIKLSIEIPFNIINKHFENYTL